MTRWHAVVPVKPVAERKTRLQHALAPQAIAALTERMLQHVLAVASATEAIGEVTLLAVDRFGGWQGNWFPDPGGGLNVALAGLARAVPERMVVLHADLPGLSVADIAALVSAAEHGDALAPDRHGTGTNALALRNASRFDFSFGPDSFARHLAGLPGGATVDRPGFGLDIDVPEDLDRAARLGYFHEAT